MLASSIRASRSSIARIATSTIAKRSYTPSAIRSADLVQDLYLKELKAYKPTPIKASDSVGNVQVFSAPKPPKSPEESDIASQIKDYESQVVELEGQADAGAEPVAEEHWFEEEPEEEHAAH